MSVAVSPAQNAEPPAAPKTETEFQAAALAELEKLDAEPKAEEPAKAKEEPAKAKEEPKTEEPAKAKEEPKTEEPFQKGFDALAREKAALRKERQELEAKYGSIAKALESKSALAVLAAAGLKYDDATREILGDGGVPQKKAAETKHEPSPLEQRVEQLTRMIEQERLQRFQETVFSKLDAIAKEGGDKFRFTVGRGKVRDAISMLQRDLDELGEAPGKTLDENLQIYLEKVEHDLRKEAESWRSLLTPAAAPASVPAGTTPARESGEKAAPSSAASEKASKTLSNSLAAAPSKATPLEPQSPEDFQRLALLELERLQQG